jgi:PAS domain S-box-containing protein
VQVYKDLAKSYDEEIRKRLDTEATLLAGQPERSPEALERFVQQHGLAGASIVSPKGTQLLTVGTFPTLKDRTRIAIGWHTLPTQNQVAVWAPIPVDAARDLASIKQWSDQWAKILGDRKTIRNLELMLMVLITLFVLFVATWLARILANRISVPITAILEAAGEVRRGNLKHRVLTRAEDELALLVNGFNQMTEALESSAIELDRRNRFTEAILESIPTGVLSIGSDGSIQRVNQALSRIFPAEQVARATRLEDLFSRDDTAEIKYLMKRARRTGAASHTLELRTESRKVHLSVTVAALESRLTSGFVVVLEDTSELLRAQKAAAWHEVARRVAHEIKNPLTPIALSAERIGRQLDKLDVPPGPARIIHECADTISKSVESVKTLVDEFSTFARFPSAQPVRSDLNTVVSEALGIFHGRLDGITIRTNFAAGLPPVNLDREQFQRAVVNLVDNAAEAMQDALVKSLYIATQAGAAETVELVLADSGCGVSPDEKEKLFLPYFSTKNRGTGLGLAIVSHIVAEHGGQIRVEDNVPVGARFTVELPAMMESETTEAARTVAVKT